MSTIREIIKNCHIKLPLVSVIIPVYNVAPYLRECLESVIHQTYRRLQIILVDDGSTDDSGLICDEYSLKDPRISVIHKQNQGLGAARNTGMQSADGKYIIFLDSDDYWDINAIEQLVSVAEKDDLQVVVFSAEPFYDGAYDFSTGRSYNHSAQNNIVKSGRESLSVALNNKEYYEQACLRLYLLDYIRTNGFRFEEGVIHEDISFSFFAYIYADRIECLGERFYHRRYRPGSIMTSDKLVQSSLGYKTAIESLMAQSEDMFFDNSDKTLFFRQIRSCICSIYSNYRNTRKKSHLFAPNNESRLILSETRSTIRNVCLVKSGLPKFYRIVMFNFYIGYLFWLLRSLVKETKKNAKGKITSLSSLFFDCEPAYLDTLKQSYEYSA